MRIVRNLIINLITLVNVYFFKKKYKKIIFFHTPQSGGNSIHYFFKLNFGFRGFGLEDDDPSLNSNVYKKYLYIYGHFGLERMRGIDFKKDYFYLFNIRDPKNRYVSNYYRNKDLHSKNNETFISLEEFLKLRISQNADNYYTRYLSGETVNEDVKNIGESTFIKAEKNLNKINYFFILEDSKESFKKLRNFLNIKLPISNFFVLHKNKVSGSKYPELTEKEKKLLELLTTYDQKIYKKILEENKNTNN